MSVEIAERPTLTAQQARTLTDEIRQTLRVGHDLIVKAFSGRAWVALGYESWDAYCAGEFSDARMVRLDREQRREIVAEMRQAGMSTRAIASGLGVNHSTVIRDGQAEDVVADAPPAAVLGLDGKRYENLPPRREPVAKVTETTKTEHYVNTNTGEIADEPPVAEPKRQRASNRRPLPDFARDAGWELRQAIERIERVLDDDRYPQNAEQVTSALRGHLLYTAESVANALSRLSA